MNCKSVSVLQYKWKHRLLGNTKLVKIKSKTPGLFFYLTSLFLGFTQKLRGKILVEKG